MYLIVSGRFIDLNRAVMVSFSHGPTSARILLPPFAQLTLIKYPGTGRFAQDISLQGIVAQKLSVYRLNLLQAPRTCVSGSRALDQGVAAALCHHNHSMALRAHQMLCVLQDLLKPPECRKRLQGQDNAWHHTFRVCLVSKYDKCCCNI